MDLLCPMPADSIDTRPRLGMPVEIGQIGTELKKLWEQAAARPPALR